MCLANHVALLFGPFSSWPKPGRRAWDYNSKLPPGISKGAGRPIGRRSDGSCNLKRSFHYVEENHVR